MWSDHQTITPILGDCIYQVEPEAKIEEATRIDLAVIGIDRILENIYLIIFMCLNTYICYVPLLRIERHPTVKGALSVCRQGRRWKYSHYQY
jgi:hypothetical protein